MTKGGALWIAIGLIVAGGLSLLVAVDSQSEGALFFVWLFAIAASWFWMVAAIAYGVSIGLKPKPDPEEPKWPAKKAEEETT